MILLQLSSGQGPIECCKAIGLATKLIVKECKANNVSCSVIEAVDASESSCFKSVLLKLDAADASTAKQMALAWQGPMLWVCESRFRPKHKRKNWFFSGQVFEVNEADMTDNITYKACRASGAGGQHVNTTDSAIRATHTESGISVRVESERSQHANKKLAKALLFQKLEMLKKSQLSLQEKVRRQQHWELERGNPVRIFKGEKFAPATA